MNFAILLGLLAILAVTFALAGMATSLTGTIVTGSHWMRYRHESLLRIVGPILSAIADGYVRVPL